MFMELLFGVFHMNAIVAKLNSGHCTLSIQPVKRLFEGVWRICLYIKIEVIYTAFVPLRFVSFGDRIANRQTFDWKKVRRKDIGKEAKAFISVLSLLDGIGQSFLEFHLGLRLLQVDVEPIQFRVPFPTLAVWKVASKVRLVSICLKYYL